MDLKKIADELNTSLKTLATKKLYITASFMEADSKRPDRIVVEGIKNLSSTGKFTYTDRCLVNNIIEKHCEGLNIKILDSDPCMHNAVITL